MPRSFPSSRQSWSETRGIAMTLLQSGLQLLADPGPDFVICHGSTMGPKCPGAEPRMSLVSLPMRPIVGSPWGGGQV